MTVDSHPSSGKGPFTLFSFAFGLYLGIHMFLVEAAAPSWFVMLPPLAGFWLMLRPQSVPRFIFAAFLCLADTWLAMPIRSNSTMLTLVIAALILAAYVSLLIRNRSWKVDAAQLYERFAPGGRLALLAMYFFGILHKINTDFFDPQISCATLMMSKFTYLPIAFTTHPVIQYAAIYGTLIVEGLILILLLKSSWRYAGVILGVGFHLLLSFNGFQYFQPFTMLAFLLHFLFLGQGASAAFMSSSIGAAFMRHNTKIVLAWAACWVLFVCAWQAGLPVSPYWGWLPVGLCIFAGVIAFGRDADTQSPRAYFISRSHIVTLIAALYFLQGFSPYVGFKTLQTVSMFSNLRTEGGVSNHLIFRESLPLFPYQSDLVTIIDSSDPWLLHVRDLGNRFVAIDFFNYLARNPHITARYIHHGVEHDHTSMTDVWKLPTIAHKFMVFQTVPTAEKMPCMPD